MPLDVPVVLQPFGSNSCVPSCVCAVLMAFEGTLMEASPSMRDEIGELCEETELGCDLDTAIQGLTAGGYEAAWFPSRHMPLDDALKGLRNTVMDEDDPQPVIVAIQTDVRSMDDHAVVVRAFLGDRDSATGLEPTVELMDPDPSHGGIRTLSLETFARQWNFARQRAFTVRP